MNGKHFFSKWRKWMTNALRKHTVHLESNTVVSLRPFKIIWVEKEHLFIYNLMRKLKKLFVFILEWISIIENKQSKMKQSLCESHESLLK